MYSRRNKKLWIAFMILASLLFTAIAVCVTIEPEFTVIEKIVVDYISVCSVIMFVQAIIRDIKNLKENKK